ncbi:MAG: TonB-dependent receptor plug domain-containing protein [Alphaproteobacteria bacterium]|nr:TonB-dependent receptor plug domain-containing protein [Alphaproteobacteria bacterium]
MSLASESFAAQDEILITARKREERLVDVPIAATVVTGDDLLERGALTVDLNTVISGIPGARYNNLSDNALSETSLRGAGAARGTNAEVGVGLFRDGVYAAGGFQFARNIVRIDTFDLERVEVLRGTQGALFGRNAVGGAIHLITMRPQSEFGGRVALDYAWDIETLDTQLILNVPINDKIATRVSVDYWEQDKGFICSPYVARCSTKGDGVLARGQIRYTNEDLDVNFMLERQEMIQGAPFSSPMIEPGAVGGYPAGYNAAKYEIPLSSEEKESQNLNQAHLSLTYDFDFATLQWVASVRDRHTYIDIDFDRTSPQGIDEAIAQGNTAATLLMQDVTRDRKLTDDTQSLYSELHLVGALAGDKLTWLVGAEWLLQHGNYQLFDPTMNNSMGARSQTDFNYLSLAGYGGLGYDLTDRLNVEGKLRWTHDEKRATQYSWQHPNAKPTVAASDIYFDAYNLSYDLVASFDITHDVITYAKIGSGFRSGGFNPNMGVASAPIPIPATYGPEKSTTYEIGVKGNVTGWLYAAIAGYKTHVNGVISGRDNGCDAFLMNCPDGFGGFSPPTMFVDNFGNANLWGIEVESSARFEFLGGDTRLKLAASRQEGHYKGGGFDGNLIPQSPKWILGANVNYVHPIPNTELKAFGNLNYAANYGGDQEIGGSFKLEDYNIFDARLGVGYGNWELAVYAQNLTNYNYIILDTVSTERWSLPRVWGANLRFKW